MVRVLRDSGFDVTVLKNADRRKMFTTVKEFGQKLKKSDVGLFYYAGHGVQIDSANYLLPVDLKGNDLQDADDLRYNAFPLNELMERMREANTNNIIILDACRDNPFLAKLNRSASRGLAKVITPASTAVLYSTDPGNTASDGLGNDNGVFTNRLVEAIQKSSLELVDVMRQVAINVTRDTNGLQRPVFDGVLSSQFYFRVPEAPVKQTPPEPVSSSITVDAKVLELRFWESAEKAGTYSGYQYYLKKYPNGDFDDLARDRLEHLTQDTTKAERDRLAKEVAAFEKATKEAVDRARLAEERAATERMAREAAESARQEKEKAALERSAKETAERETFEKEKVYLERNAREAAERARLAEDKAALDRATKETAERTELERRIREAEVKAKQAEESSIKSEARLAQQKADIERLSSQYGTKPQIIDSIAAEKGESERLPVVEAEEERKAKKSEKNVQKRELYSQGDVVVDADSGLMWTRNCKLTPNKISIDHTDSLIEKLNREKYAGFADWRIPSNNQFKKLYNSAKIMAGDKREPLEVIRETFIDYQNWEYWTNKEKKGNRWRAFDLEYGTSKYLPYDDLRYLIAVRSLTQQ